MECRRTILIVEDDPGVIQTFARMLQILDYQVVTALDAESGLLQMARAHPDAVLLDLRMPFVDGLAFLRRLRLDSNDRTPVAIVTGDYFIDDSLTRELQELDASVYFKPVWIEDLAHITEELLRNHS